jgi:hypothetical protein
MEAEMHSRKRMVCVCLVTLVLGLLLQRSTLAQASLRYGTWKLNPAKSTYNPGPAPKSEVRTYKANGDGLANTSLYDTIALTAVDDLTLNAVQKKARRSAWIPLAR